MSFKEISCSAFVRQLASAEPVPGGGGAAALCAAIGAALGNMVGSLTLGKKKYAEVQEQVIALKIRYDALQEKLLSYIDADAEVFAPLAAAYGLPRATEAEKAHKAQVMEEALRVAVTVPLQIFETCCEALDLTAEIGQIGSRLAISDAACSAALLKAALQSAAVNIFINTQLMQDRSYAIELNRKTEAQLSIYSAKAEQIFERIAQTLKAEKN